MDVLTLEGGFTVAPTESATAFRAALNVMARPGLIQDVCGATGPAPLSIAASVLLLTLCDPETPVYLAGDHDTQAVRDWITFHTGAPLTDAGTAMFAVGRWSALTPYDAYPLGVPQYPDRSATLIVEQDTLGAGAILTGPGIEHQASLNIPDVDFAQTNARRYPLGLDMFLTAGSQVAALPRTTKVR